MWRTHGWTDKAGSILESHVHETKNELSHRRIAHSQYVCTSVKGPGTSVSAQWPSGSLSHKSSGHLKQNKLTTVTTPSRHLSPPLSEGDICIIPLKLNMRSNLREELEQISTCKDNIICTSELHYLTFLLSTFHLYPNLVPWFLLLPPPSLPKK